MKDLKPDESFEVMEAEELIDDILADAVSAHLLAVFLLCVSSPAT